MCGIVGVRSEGEPGEGSGWTQGTEEGMMGRVRASGNSHLLPARLGSVWRTAPQALREVVAWISSESRASRGVSLGSPRDTSLRIASASAALFTGKTRVLS